LKYGACELPMMLELEWFSNQIQMTCLYVGAVVAVPHGPAASAGAVVAIVAAPASAPAMRAEAAAA
jgi:hypothetical protein